jgi:hypothetical protein
MRRTTLSVALLVLIPACRRSPESIQDRLTAVVKHDSAGRSVAQIDSVPSVAYPGDELYVGHLEPSTPHMAPTIVALRQGSGRVIALGLKRTLPDSWPPWPGRVANDNFLAACEELVSYFAVGEPHGVLRVGGLQAVPFHARADSAKLSQIPYAVVDSTGSDSTQRHLEYTGYRDGDLYRFSCDFAVGHPPRVWAMLLTERIGGVSPILGRPLLRDLSPSQ